ncbi:copper resistance protein NlpE [Spirosoma montaniterrae]|nr:copper resistance protein NlpE [Spirosoma montaniterrae]
MKTLIITLCTAVLLWNCQSKTETKEQTAVVERDTLVDGSTSRTALDYAGTYKGTLPCADCEGIETEVQLTENGEFVKKTKYLGKGDGKVSESKGKFEWKPDGNTITLTGVDMPNQYAVGENTLTHLDMEGKKITGENADKYVLRK